MTFRTVNLRVPNRVLLTLALSAGISSTAVGFISVAPNRLISGQPVTLWAALDSGSNLGIAALMAAMIVLSLCPATKAINWIITALGSALVLLILFAVGHAAMLLTAGAAPAARASPGAAFWILLFCATLAIVNAMQGLRTGPLSRLAIAAFVCATVAAMGNAGTFDALSIVREYQNKREVFGAEVGRHCTLVLGSLLPALFIGVPLGALAVGRSRLRGPLFAILNVLQTVPSIALFGILIAPMSALADAVPTLAFIGVGGIGVAPAIIALILYALLPVVRNTYAGLARVDRAVIEAAEGMGLTDRQVFRKVQVPLAMPVLLAGLRIVMVQAVGLAVVAALVGAGGLGTFVFQGLGQNATNLVLLGAIPAILLALAADFLLRTATHFIRGRGEPCSR